MAGLKMPTPVRRSMPTRASVMATTGVARTIITLVAYKLQQNSGSRNQVIPGARIL